MRGVKGDMVILDYDPKKYLTLFNVAVDHRPLKDGIVLFSADHDNTKMWFQFKRMRKLEWNQSRLDQTNPLTTQ